MPKSTQVIDPDGIFHEVFFPDDLEIDDDSDERDPEVTAAFEAIPEAALTILEGIFDGYLVDYYRTHPEEIKVYPKAKRQEFMGALVEEGAYEYEDEDDMRYVMAYGVMEKMALEYD